MEQFNSGGVPRLLPRVAASRRRAADLITTLSRRCSSAAASILQDGYENASPDGRGDRYLSTGRT
uniref:Uncharacterized protein n=1 Tax=Oryza rufipogon TaxID=4529 RepID=A0A0E0QWS3_ORYRU